MQYINHETGEVLDLVPYWSARSRTSRLRRARRHAGTWTAFSREMVPIMVGLALLWSLLTFGR